MTITIVNKYKPIKISSNATVIYCGRGSALGNPFMMNNPTERDEVCNRYDLWLRNVIDGKINIPTIKLQEIHKQLHNIRIAVVAGDVYLQCFCAPLRCHCTTIKNIIEESMRK